MTERAAAIQELFHRAMAEPDRAARASLLDRECAPELRDRLEALLRAHDAAGVLDRPVIQDQPIKQPAAPDVDRYALVERIGEGGMGEVWIAQQSAPVRRRVAIKLVRAGMDSKAVLARFNLERQAVAVMDHPNIAKVFDAGENAPAGFGPAAGRPYFVMEYVNGVPLTRYCDEHRLTPRQRLELFVPICRAVQHAHQKGVVHRDLKPSNILVASLDGRPVPKVIDFGVAKSVGGDLTANSLTQFGAVVGTLEYMAPEQAGSSSADVDTRADIYSLGVILYELLTGLRPHDSQRLQKAALAEMIRVITEEEPSKPSTRLSTADALPSLAAARQTEPKRLTALLRGELDWVVMKCLAKDRERRYESAAGLALDVERHLSGEPVAACPPSRAYLARKFIRRHRGPMIAAVSLLTLLVAGIVGTSWGLIEAKAATDRERKAKNEAISEGRRAEEQARTAKEEAKIAQMERQFLLVDLLGQADPAVQAETIREAGGGTPVKENPTIKELLDRCALKATPDNLATRFPEEKRVQTAVLGALGRAFYGIGEYQRAADHLQRAVNLSIDAFGPAHDDCLCHMRNLALVYVLIDRAADAVKLHEQVRDALTARLGSDADATLDALACLAAAYRSNGQPDKAVPLMEEVLAKQQQRHGPADKATWPVRNNLALALANMGKTDRAITILNSLQDDQTAALPPGDPTLLLTRHNLALIYIEAGQPSKAIELAAGVLEERRKLFGPNHPVTQSSQHNLASAYRDSGNYKKSAELYEQLLEQRRRQLGPDDSATVNTANGLAKVYYHGRQPAKAVALWEEILTIRLRQFGVDHPKTMVTVSNLAHCYRNVPDYPKSIANFRRLLDYETNAYGREDRRTQYTLNTMAIVCKMSGDYEQALPLLREAVDFAERNGWKDRDSHRMVDNLILVLEKLGKADEAEAWKKKQPPEPK